MFCYLSDLEISRDLSYKDEIEKIGFFFKNVYISISLHHYYTLLVENNIVSFSSNNLLQIYYYEFLK